MSDSTGTEGFDGDGAEVPAVELTPAGGRRRRRALWGALVVLAVAGGALAVNAADDDEPPRLPLALGASPEAGGKAATASDMSMMAYVHYVAGDDLPELGGSGVVYRLAGGATEAQVRSLATALGMTGDPKHEDGYWNLESGDAQLQVYDDGGGSWWFNAHTFVDDGTSSSGSAGCPPDAKECAVSSGEAEVCSTDAKCLPSTTTSTISPDLPSRSEAEAIARDVLDATGMDVANAEVTVDGPYDAWYVNVSPRVGGQLVSGLAASVGVGPHGEVLNAGGMLGTPERVGDYPTIDTGKAIDRLNEGTAFGSAAGSSLSARDMGSGEAVAPVEAVAPAEPTSTTLAVLGGGSDPGAPADTPVSDDVSGYAADAIAAIEAGEAVPTTVPGAAVTDPAYPCGPYPVEPTEPTEVVLHRAERTLVMIGASDGSGDMYLVPGYRMEGDGDWVVDVPSVDDESLLPTTPVEPADNTGGGADGSTTGSSPGVDPGTTRCAQLEPGPDGAVPDICLDPNTVEPSEGTTTGSVDPG